MIQSNRDASLWVMSGLIEAESAAIARFLAAPHQIFAESVTAIACQAPQARCSDDRAEPAELADRANAAGLSFFLIPGANAHDTTAYPRSR